MYKDMEQWTRIRLEELRDGKPKRQVLRENRMHWTTLENILRHPQPPGCRVGVERRKRKLGPYLKRIEAILGADTELPKKQRHHDRPAPPRSPCRAT